MHRTRWLLFALLLLFHSVALAESNKEDSKTQAVQQAGERFDRGVQLFKEEDYRAALVEFQRAYELAPDYRLLYNIGGTKYALLDYLGATQAYESYLAQGGSEVPADRRAQVEETLTQLRNRVGKIDLEVDREDVEVFVDDARVGIAPLAPFLANIGRHRVTVRARDGASSTELVDVAGGETVRVRMSLGTPSSALSSGSLSGAATARDRSWSGRRKAAVVGWVVGGGLLVGSAVTGALSLGAKSKLDDLLDIRDVDPQTARDQHAKVDRLSLTTDIMLGVGVAAVVSGTVLWLVGDKREQQAPQTGSRARAQMGLSVGVRLLAVSGRF